MQLGRYARLLPTPKELENWLKHNNVYKLPEKVYQIMYGIAQTVSGKDVYFEGNAIDVEELRKSKVRKVLVDWIEEHHPDKGLSNFCDLSIREAKAIHSQLEWGMYIQLLPKPDARGVYIQCKENFYQRTVFQSTKLTNDEEASELRPRSTPLLPG